jgi:hypothetical protein
MAYFIVVEDFKGGGRRCFGPFASPAEAEAITCIPEPADVECPELIEPYVREFEKASCQEPGTRFLCRVYATQAAAGDADGR